MRRGRSQNEVDELSQKLFIGDAVCGLISIILLTSICLPVNISWPVPSIDGRRGYALRVSGQPQCWGQLQTAQLIGTLLMVHSHENCTSN